MRTIAHITDVHLHEAFPLEQEIDPRANWNRMLAYLKERGIEEVVFGGDIGAETAHTFFFESLNNFKVNIVLGNHDLGELARISAAGKDGHYYLFEDENYRYLVLDSSADRLYKQQVEWLRQAAKTDKKIILFIHHPILEVPCYVDAKYPMKNREVIRKILFDTNLEVTVFCGHYHLEDERTEQNIRQLVTPAISYQMVKSHKKLVDNSVFGGRIIHISPDSIDTEVVMFAND
ncbi:MAG: hypothetical protein Roseis2KO_57490 [Roseivirga sp.]